MNDSDVINNDIGRTCIIKHLLLFIYLALQSYIPKTLEHVRNVEEDVNKITSGQGTEDMYYKTITGLKQALESQPSLSEKNTNSTSNPDPQDQSESDGSELNSESDEDEDESEDEERSDRDRNSENPIDKKAARKENKKKVKEEKREARKHKVPKAVKKKKKKLAKSTKAR